MEKRLSEVLNGAHGFSIADEEKTGGYFVLDALEDPHRIVHILKVTKITHVHDDLFTFFPFGMEVIALE